MLERRSFLKLGVALGLVRYTEPIAALVEPVNPWIEDRGDFLIVRVPDGKTLAREVFSKPAIVWLGACSILRDVECQSFVNFAAKPGSLVQHVSVDCSRVATDRQRAAVLVRGNGGSFLDTYIRCGPSNDCAIHLEHGTIDRLHIHAVSGPSGFASNVEAERV